jgi:hypothetical protein
MQTLRTQLQVARLVLMKRRAAKPWAERNKPSTKEFCAASALQVIDLLRALDSMPQAIDDALSLSITQTH